MSQSKINKDELSDLCNRYTVKELAKYYNCTEGSIRQALRYIGKKAKCHSQHTNINIEDIVEQINQGKSYKEIANKYNVNADTIRMRYTRYLDKIGVRTKIPRKKEIRCVELDIKFSQIIDAARFIIANNIVRSNTENNVAYKISKAAKENSKYGGYTWVFE